jgi:hypothetical protein
MAREKDSQQTSTAAPSQLQSASSETEQKRQTPEKEAAKNDEPQFFDTTIAKLVEREVEDKDGNKTTEWVEVMSDNLYPGEKLKRADDEEKAAEKDKAARKAATEAGRSRDADRAREAADRGQDRDRK